jgi:hypothetical protein
VAQQTLPHVVRSYSADNQKLPSAFEQHLITRGNSPTTIRSYCTTVGGFVQFLGSA